MFLRNLSNAAAAAALVAGLCAASTAAAAPAASPKTQQSAAQATGKPTTDAPAGTQTQGTAWAVKQATSPAAATTPATGRAAGAAAAPMAAKVVPHGDLVETLRASGQFKTFLKAADAANLTGVLKTNRNLTLFAPTDAAFAALPPGQLDKLMADPAGLQKLLSHHIINARVDSSKIKGAKGPVPSVAGDPIELDGSGGLLKADNADIIQPDVIASNGVLQVVDQVLTPGAAAAAGASAAPAAATAGAAPSANTSVSTTTTTTETKGAASQTTPRRKR